MEEQEKEKKNLEAKVKTKNQENVPQPNAIRDKATIGEEINKRKLTFKEKKEFDTLEIEIPVLEIEKTEIERQLSSGELSTDEILAASQRFSELSNIIDEKTMRWLELSEL